LFINRSYAVGSGIINRNGFSATWQVNFSHQSIIVECAECRSAAAMFLCATSRALLSLMLFIYVAMEHQQYAPVTTMGI